MMNGFQIVKYDGRLWIWGLGSRVLLREGEMVPVDGVSGGFRVVGQGWNGVCGVVSV